ncbi:PhzF family phenazine biosynthesis protein [Fusibacter ferrireducens]|uniref:PhzF family phenazine biosynthesis protein n=1 Tax=Fusibacter ferrireducens TaxID=2785058 RepID=A0ABR9ZTH9_9FIRM|nr:PhzF family phenazine biosynthesis protein [Fusibacter ferrireducens]MBF4693180.1 PhzF family phenazine biosynthesis protein [Fusibacter ferrireducens]
MKAYKVNSFTHHEMGGNLAGVVLLENPLDDISKQKIASKLGYSETAFVLKSDEDTSDFVVTFFTPTEEVPLCGHATIAAFHVLNTLHLLPKRHLVQKTKAGLLKIEIEEGSPMIYMSQTTPRGETLSELSKETLGHIFSISAEDMTCYYDAYSHQIQLPVEIWDTGLRDILLPIKNRALLNALSVDFKKLSALSASENVVGVHAFTYENNQIYARNFAPLYGIDEESATGTSNGALTGYLYHHIRLNGFGKMKSLELKILQGETMGLTSEIHTKCHVHESSSPEIWVGGYARIETTIDV